MFLVIDATECFTDLDMLNLVKFAYGGFSFRLKVVYATAFKKMTLNLKVVKRKSKFIFSLC